MTGAQSVGQMSSRGTRLGAAFGHFTGITGLAERREVVQVGDVVAEIVAHGLGV